MDLPRDLLFRFGMCLSHDDEDEQEQTPFCVTEIVKSTRNLLNTDPVKTFNVMKFLRAWNIRIQDIK